MSATRPTLAATTRTVTGKAVAHLRQAGRLPAVVYGHGIDSASVSVDAHDFERLRRRIGPNTLVDLSVDGRKARPVLIHGVQAHAVTGRPLHADLFVVKMTEDLTVDVPLVATGESEAVRLHAGVLLHPTEHVKVKALPDHLPQAITYDLAALVTFDDVIHVRDLAIPSDVTLLTDGDEIVVKVAHPRIEEAPLAAAATAAEAAEAAAAAEAGAAAEGAAAAESASEG
jgi:large subunit ribosomal protein L25